MCIPITSQLVTTTALTWQYCLLCSLIIILKGKHAYPHLHPQPTFGNIFTFPINWIVCWHPLCGQTHGILCQSDQINYIFWNKTFKSVKFDQNTILRVVCIMSMYEENTLFQAVVWLREYHLSVPTATSLLSRLPHSPSVVKLQHIYNKL